MLSKGADVNYKSDVAGASWSLIQSFGVIISLPSVESTVVVAVVQ